MFETAPSWIWIVYYLFLLSTIVTSIYSITYRKFKVLSIITLLIAISIPVISIVNSMGRGHGINEFEHLFNQLKSGYIWSIYVTIGFLYLFFWWIIFFIKYKRNRK